MKNLFIPFIILLQISGHAAVIPDHLIHHADSTEPGIQISHEKLSKYLAEGAQNEEEKVLIFCYWIAKNIKYNLREAKDHDRTNKTAYEVLQNKKAVCEGYSILFNQFCQNEGIESYIVIGYGYGNFIRRFFSQYHMSHAWNAVCVNGDWKLIDITWAVSELKTKVFKETRQLNWIFSDPEDFSKSHYPNDPRWQMLRNYKTKKEFWHQSENVSEKNYAIQDSLKILLKRKRYQNELIIFASEFAEQKDKHDYLKNLILLGWSYVGGSYNPEKIKQGIEIFSFARSEVKRIDPALNKSGYLGNINKGFQISDYRLENKQ